jgi:hypothetical protein
MTRGTHQTLSAKQPAEPVAKTDDVAPSAQTQMQKASSRMRPAQRKQKPKISKRDAQHDTRVADLAKRPLSRAISKHGKPRSDAREGKSGLASSALARKKRRKDCVKKSALDALLAKNGVCAKNRRRETLRPQLKLLLLLKRLSVVSGGAFAKKKLWLRR